MAKFDAKLNAIMKETRAQFELLVKAIIGEEEFKVWKATEAPKIYTVKLDADDDVVASPRPSEDVDAQNHSEFGDDVDAKLPIVEELPEEMKPDRSTSDDDLVQATELEFGENVKIFAGKGSQINSQLSNFSDEYSTVSALSASTGEGEGRALFSQQTPSANNIDLMLCSSLPVPKDLSVHFITPVTSPMRPTPSLFFLTTQSIKIAAKFDRSSLLWSAITRGEKPDIDLDSGASLFTVSLFLVESERCTEPRDKGGGVELQLFAKMPQWPNSQFEPFSDIANHPTLEYLQEIHSHRGQVKGVLGPAGFPCDACHFKAKLYALLASVAQEKKCICKVFATFWGTDLVPVAEKAVQHPSDDEHLLQAWDKQVTGFKGGT